MASDSQNGVPVHYVVLHHTGVVPEHYDLLVHLPSAEKLLTWRIPTPPETWAAAPPAAERIADHRLTYLTYEGEISGGRGHVKCVAEGEAELQHAVDGMRLRMNSTTEVHLPDLS